MKKAPNPHDTFFKRTFSRIESLPEPELSERVETMLRYVIETAARDRSGNRSRLDRGKFTRRQYGDFF